MKKLISILSAAAMLAGMTTMTSFAAENGYTLGDVNGDGVIDDQDAYLVIENTSKVMVSNLETWRDGEKAKAYLNENYGFTEAQYDAADTNGNGYMDVDDATFILIYIVSRDYGTNIELKPENREAICEDASKARRENYLVCIHEDEETWKYVSDKDAYITQNILYLGNYSADHVEDEKYIDYSDGEYYEMPKADGTVDLYVYFGGIKPGDANADGVVDSLDATVVLYRSAYILLNGAAADADTLERDICSDYNGDGSVDPLDATAILVDYAETLNK